MEILINIQNDRPRVKVDLFDFDGTISTLRHRLEDPNYYYRHRKNIVNRPISRDGKGYHFCGDHKLTIPNLYKKLIDKLPEVKKGIDE